MKVIIDCRSVDFAIEVSLLAKNTGHPIIKNENGIIVIYLRSEAEKNIFERQFYEMAKSFYSFGCGKYTSIKFKKHTPILDRRYKKER